MRTVEETPTFQRQADRLWTEDERLAFVTWLAANPDAGDVIPGAGGARKVRWGRAGQGKSGGVRTIYFHLVEREVVRLVALYAKSERANLPATDIKELRT
jgi:hypothetical protein